MWRSIVLACAGGALGSGLRALVTIAVTNALGTGFPYATMGINIAGSFLIGVVAELAGSRLAIGADMRTFLAVGVLGGFTTFSSFSYETLGLLAAKQAALAVLYAAGSVVLGVLAAYLGMLAVRLAAP